MGRLNTCTKKAPAMSDVSLACSCYHALAWESSTGKPRAIPCTREAGSSAVCIVNITPDHEHANHRHWKHVAVLLNFVRIYVYHRARGVGLVYSLQYATVWSQSRVIHYVVISCLGSCFRGDPSKSPTLAARSIHSIQVYYRDSFRHVCLQQGNHCDKQRLLNTTFSTHTDPTTEPGNHLTCNMPPCGVRAG
jgi:hypothetical protein